MSRYSVPLLLAGIMHCMLFLNWSRAVELAQLPMKKGSQAVSIQLIQHTRSVTKPRKPSDNIRPKPLSQVSGSRSIIVPKIIPSKPIIKTSAVTAENKPAINVVKPALNKFREPSATPINKEPELTRAPVTHEKKSELALEPKANKKNSFPPAMSLRAKKNQGVASNAVSQSSNQPKYPRRAVIRNQQGRVEVEIWINRQGLAQRIKLLKSSGYSLLDKSVLRFIEQEKFFPAMQDGIAIASSQVFSFRFEIN